MIININIQIPISDENLPLIPIVINDNGGKSDIETQDEAVMRITEDNQRGAIMGLISPSLQGYFGKVMQTVAMEKLAQLENVTTVTTTIIRSDV